MDKNNIYIKYQCTKGGCFDMCVCVYVFNVIVCFIFVWAITDDLQQYFSSTNKGRDTESKRDVSKMIDGTGKLEFGQAKFL